MMTTPDAFGPLRIALERAGVRFAVGGSWASTAYGEARFTNDVDIVADFTAESLERFMKGPSGNVLCRPRRSSSSAAIRQVV
jgi:hypothetical protein